MMITTFAMVFLSMVGSSLSAEYFCSQFYENITSRDFFRLTVDDNTPVGATVKRFVNPWNQQSAAAFQAGDITYLSFDHENYEIKVISPLYPKIGKTLRLLGTCIDYIEEYNYEIKLDVTIWVYVNDINNPPVFANLPNTTTLYENSSVGSIVYELSLDESLDFEESFKTTIVEILSVTGDTGTSQVHPFILNDDLQVILNAPLDYEVGPKQYEVTFYAEDGAVPPLSNTNVLTISVGDVDDMSPQLSHSHYRRQVIGERPVQEPECVDTEPTLVAVDGDGDASATILYTIVEGTPDEYWSEYFELDSASGKLCQLKTVPRLSLDEQTGRETFLNFTFTVRAYQEDDAEKYDEAILFLGVMDSNEHAPEFDRKLYRVTVPEWPEITTGERLIQLSASDEDHGMNSEFEYSLSEDVAHLLWIEPGTGWLVARNATLFDRETWERIEFKVFAQETMTAAKKITSARVQLTLEDANDNPPVFISDHLEVSIKDNMRPGNMLAQKHKSLAAVDLDSGDNGEVIYKLHSVERVGGRTSLVDLGRFTVDPDHGYVHLAGSLSDLRRQRQHPTYLLTISATDRARNESSRMSSFATMAVQVQETNEFPPVVTTPRGTKTTTIHVNESAAIGSIIAQLPVSDADGDEDIYLKYRISDRRARAVFDVNSGGAVVIKNALDRENIPRYNFRIRITDGVHTVKTEVVVIVEDSNDNKPSFSQEEYRFTLKENPPRGSEVGKLSATDPDSGLNGKLIFTMENKPESEPFEITEDGTIFVSKSTALLDREKISELKFKVIASDAGPAPLVSSANVIVELEDVNDNPPVFSSAVYHGTLEEDDSNPKPQIVTLDLPINATDEDADFQHRDIRYSLTGPGSELFHMNPVRADIVVRKPGSLDCEKKCSYALEIHATDQGGNGTKVTSSLLIELRDVNDETPRFVGRRRFRVTDDTMGATVGIIKAKDNDVTPPNNNILYILQQGGYGKFAIDFNTGEIKVSADLDNEPVQASYVLLVEAVDGGMPRQSQQTNVTIRVPVNTPPIILANTTSFKVPEDSALNSTVGKVLVVDDCVTSANDVIPDITDEDDASMEVKGNVGLVIDPSARDNAVAKLKYFINDLSVPFSVNKRGEITTKMTLDRETVSSYTFDLYVSDNGVPSRTASALVTVQVDDVNDNPPRFLIPHYQGRVKEDNAAPLPGQQVKMLSQNILAIDDDSTANSTGIRYSLRGEGSQYFAVDPVKGHLRVSPFGVGKIDRERAPFYKFKVVATDASGKGLSAAADVVVEVEDVNDVTPRFFQQTQVLNVSSKVSAGQIIGQVQALDGDSTEPNNQVIYSLANDGLGKFSVDAETGSVVAQQGLYYLPRQDSYVLEIVARDLGYPSRVTSQTITVMVQQYINDFKPEFQGRTIFHTDEEVPVGKTIGKLKTVDEDGEQVSLYISKEDRVPFAINPMTGIITTTARLDCDGGGPRYFTFSVIARDNGDPPKTTEAYVGVIVDDINDNPPKFTQEIYDHSVSDVFPPQTTVATPFAFDDIDGMQTIYYYEMKGPGAGDYLTIDPDTGIVRTTELIRTLNATQLEFQLEATDVYKPKLKANALLRVTIYKGQGKPCCCLVPCEKKP